MESTDASAIAKAKSTLLNALEQLEEAEQTLEGTPDRVDLIVVYSIGRDPEGGGAWHEVGGWASTGAPKWVHAAMLRRAADSFDTDVFASDNDPDEEEDT